MQAAQRSGHGKRCAATAELLTGLAAPSALFDAAHVEVKLGAGGHEHVVHEHTVLPAAVDDEAFEQQERPRRRVGDLEELNGWTAVELADRRAFRRTQWCWFRRDGCLGPDGEECERSDLRWSAEVDCGDPAS